MLNTRSFILAGGLICVGQCLPVFAQRASTDEDRIGALQEKYRESVDSLDPKTIDEIWSHDQPVSFIHPLGTDDGLAAIKADIYGKTMDMFSKRELLFDTSAIHVVGNSAWSEIAWTFHAVWKESGKAVTTHGRETQIFLKENGHWHIVHVHYSGPPIKIPEKGV